MHYFATGGNDLATLPLTGDEFLLRVATVSEIADLNIRARESAVDVAAAPVVPVTTHGC